MNNIEENAHELVNHIYYDGIKPLIVKKENYAYIRDPIFNIKRNRVVAEVVKAMIRLKLEPDGNLIEKFCNFLIKNQNKDGSWNEIHPNYNQPSALVTSIVGEALLMNYQQSQKNDLERPIHNASRFVLSQEISTGYFIKSIQITADHLNVDATCGAFLALYGQEFSEENTIEIARRAAKHILKYQFSDGSFPYTVNKGNYTYKFDVPCIHYQGVTLFYLAKINEVINEEWLKNCLKNGVQWLSDTQMDDGRFNWTKSGLMFSYYLSGVYAFTFSVLMYGEKWEKKYLNNARLCLDILERNMDGLVVRWEKGPWRTFPLSIPITLKTALIGNFPLKHKLFRFGYGIYRQYARRGFSDTPLEDYVFTKLTTILNLNYSVIEASKNFHDLFMTSECIDCLAQALLWSE